MRRLKVLLGRILLRLVPAEALMPLVVAEVAAAYGHAARVICRALPGHAPGPLSDALRALWRLAEHPGRPHAVQFIGGGGLFTYWPDWLVDAIAVGTVRIDARGDAVEFDSQKHGRCVARLGDWLIMHDDDGLCGCERGVFAAAYGEAA